MPYPVIDLRGARTLRDDLLAAMGAGTSIDDLQAKAQTDDGPARNRQGPDVPLEEVWAASTQAHGVWIAERSEPNEAAKAQDLYQLEATMAGVVHGCLRSIEVNTLADPDFWRYLALGPFRWYLMTREPELQDQDFGGTNGNRKYWLLIRTFLWGQLAYEPGAADPYRRTTIVGETSMNELGKPGMVIDFWHSHLIRRYFAVTPDIAHSFIDEATSAPFALDEGTAREDRHANAFARRMTRLGRTVDLAVIDSKSAQELVREQKLRALGDWTPR